MLVKPKILKEIATEYKHNFKSIIKTSMAVRNRFFMKNYANAEKKSSESLRLLSEIPDKQHVIYKILPNPQGVI